MSQRFYRDEGLVLKKSQLLKDRNLITLFSKDQGKLVLTGFGVKKPTSRRLSHLETGNYIRFSYMSKGDFLTLKETDLTYGHSKIKEDEDKLHLMFQILFFLQKILPEQQEEFGVFNATIEILKKLNNEDIRAQDVDDYLATVLLELGYVDVEETQKPTFDAIKFTEGLINRKIRID